MALSGAAWFGAGAQHLGELAKLKGELELAREVHDESLAIARQTGHLMRQSMIHLNLGFIHLRLGRYRLAESCCRESLLLELQWGQEMQQEGSALVGFAGAAGAQGDSRRALQLLGAVEAVYEESGTMLAPGDQPEYEAIVAALRQQLDEVTFEALRAAGRKMTWEQIVRLALQTGRVR